MHSRGWQGIPVLVPALYVCMCVSILHVGVQGNYSYEFFLLFSSVDDLTHKSPPSHFPTLSPSRLLFLSSSVSFSGQMLGLDASD